MLIHLLPNICMYNSSSEASKGFALYERGDLILHTAKDSFPATRLSPCTTRQPRICGAHETRKSTQHACVRLEYAEALKNQPLVIKINQSLASPVPFFYKNDVRGLLLNLCRFNGLCLGEISSVIMDRIRVSQAPKTQFVSTLTRP